MRLGFACGGREGNFGDAKFKQETLVFILELCGASHLCGFLRALERSSEVERVHDAFAVFALAVSGPNATFFA